MGLYACWGVLCALAWITPCLSQGDDVFAVVVDVQVEGQVDLDICKTLTCPQGTKCEVQMAPALLKIPMPRCVPDKNAPPVVDGCKEITVATNILQCRSQEEWSQVGRTQCQLNPLEGQSTRLIHSKASHVCPPLRFPPMIRYLSASFNCCVADMDVETTSLPEIATPSKEEESPDAHIPVVKTEPEPEVQEVMGTTTQQSKGLQYIKDRISDLGEEAIKLTGIDSTQSTEQSSNVFYLLLLILGLSFLLSFLLISLLVSLRLRQRRKRQRQHKEVVTSVVNPGAADTDLEHIVQFSNDKASLVDHMQITH